MNTAPHPLDFDALRKGSVITADEIAQAIDIPKDAPSFQVGALNLASQVERELLARGLATTVVIRGQGIRVLTDAEASEHNRRMFRRRLRGLVRDHSRAMRVDRAELDTEHLAAHDRALLEQGKYLSSIRETRKQLRLAPVQDERPKIT